MSVLYGSGALLVREACVRWGAGWPDLGVLGSYGRLAGVNWVWSLELTIYHCLFSICIPIVLTELAFPKWRDERWLKTPGLVVFGVLLAADVAYGFGWLAPYRPPRTPYLGAVIAVAGLVRLSAGPVSIAPARATEAPRVPGPRELQFFLFAATCTALFFALNWILPSGRLVPPVVTISLVAALVVGFVAGLRELVRAFSWTAANQWALASGALAFFVAFSQLVELDRNRPDDPRACVSWASSRPLSCWRVI